MNIYFGSPSQNPSRQHSNVSDPELAEEGSLPRLIPGSIMSNMSFLGVPSKFLGSNSINVLNNENCGRAEYADEGNEDKKKLSEWSIPENISENAMRVQAELIHKTVPKPSQWGIGSRSISGESNGHRFGSTKWQNFPNHD